MAITDSDKLAEIRREQKLRRRHYPQWIRQGKIEAARAAQQLSILAAIEFDYARKVGEVQSSLFDAGEAPSAQIVHLVPQRAACCEKCGLALDTKCELYGCPA